MGEGGCQVNLKGSRKVFYAFLLQMSRVADMAGVRVSLEKGEGREAILLLEGFPQGCRRARGIIQVSHNNGIIYYHYLLVNLSWSL